MASAPVTRSGMVMELGWSWGNGVSGCAVDSRRNQVLEAVAVGFGVVRGHTATTYSRLQRSTPRTSVVPSVSSTSEPSGPLLVTVATAPGMNPASSK
jgi:hypothetical protein